jgi:AcrR family transcriptional regulator
MYNRVVQTRDRLVRSAGELLWERGYVGTSPRAIQERAGAGQGSMYHHFDGKHALAVSAIELLADDVRGQADAVLAGRGSAVERVVAYLQMQRDPLKGCPLGRLAHDPEVVADPELRRPVDRFLSWLVERLAALLREAQQEGDVSASLDPSAVAAAVVATVQGGYVLARAHHDPAAQSRAVDGLVGLLMPGGA